MFTLWHVHKSFFGELVLLQVSFIEVDTSLKDGNEFLRRVCIVVPKVIISWKVTLLWLDTLADELEVQDVCSAVLDHLVSDLDKQAGHTLIGVVISGNRMNHLDAVHEGWEGLLNSLWCSIVEWLDVGLE